MAFSTNECAWAQVSIKIFGTTITGCRGFSFKNAVEKEHLYAAGAKPIDIMTGNEKPEGSLKLLKYEVDRLNDAALAAGFTSILTVPHELVLITCAFKKTKISPLYVVDAIGVAFSEYEVAMDQNAKFSETTVPFLAMQITLRRG